MSESNESMFDVFSESNSTDECLHRDTFEEGAIRVCVDCGTACTQDPSPSYMGIGITNYVNTEKRERGIFTDLKKLKIQDDVMTEANNLYLIVTKGKTSRMKARAKVIYACTFHAYRKLGRPVMHSELLKVFNMKKSQGLAGIRFVSLNAPKESYVHDLDIADESIIKDIANKFSPTEEQIQEIITLHDRIKNRSAQLNGVRPQSVITGLIYYWVSITNSTLSLEEISSTSGLSTTTVQKTSKIIRALIESE